MQLTSNKWPTTGRLSCSVHLVKSGICPFSGLYKYLNARFIYAQRILHWMILFACSEQVYHAITGFKKEMLGKRRGVAESQSVSEQQV